MRRFLFLGRLDPEKGLFELADALRDVLARHPDVTLTVAGEGPAGPDLRARFAELGIEHAVTFAGRIPYEQLGQVFDAHDCMVLPSYSEGMPLSVLEAAAHRRVLIITDVGDVRELFGDRIRICAPRDTAALTAAMEEAVADPEPRADYGDVVQRVGIATVTGAILAELGVA